MIKSPSLFVVSARSFGELQAKPMGSETNPPNPSDCESLLPPRKRLLAGFKRQNSDSSLPISEDRRRDFHSLLNSSELTSEEVVESLRSAALTAAKTAAAARKVAAEKATAATNAKEFASRVLQLVASISGDERYNKHVEKRKSLGHKFPPNDQGLSGMVSRKFKNAGEAWSTSGDNGSSASHTEISHSPLEGDRESSDPEFSEKPGRIMIEKAMEGRQTPQNLDALKSHSSPGFGRRERKKEKQSPSHYSRSNQMEENHYSDLHRFGEQRIYAQFLG